MIFWDVRPLSFAPRPGEVFGNDLFRDSSMRKPHRPKYPPLPHIVSTSALHRHHLGEQGTTRSFRTVSGKSWSVYLPTDAEINFLKTRFPRMNPVTPGWGEIQADLIANGHSTESLALLAPPAIIALLNGSSSEGGSTPPKPGKRQSTQKGGLFPPSEIVVQFGLDKSRDLDAIEKRLQRWRERNPSGGWIENPERTSVNNALYLYPIDVVEPIIQDYTASRDVSHKRPTKKQ